MDEIKTEVDRLIEVLQARPGKAVRLSELTNLTGLSIAQVRKWIHILEERGQVKISYSLSDELIEWKGQPGVQSRPSPSQSQEGLPGEDSDSDSTDSAQDSHMEIARFNEQRYRRDSQAKSQDIGRASVYPRNDSFAQSDVQKTAERVELESTQAQSPSNPPMRPSIPSVRKPLSEIAAEPILPPLPKIDDASMRVSGKLKSKIAAARAKMAQIEQIKGEKKRLLIEVYRPMETKLEAEAGAITEKLIELENQLLGIREQAAGVPNEVAELAGEQERIVQISAEMRRIYSETDRQMTQSVQAMARSKQVAADRMREVGSAITQQQETLARLQEQNNEMGQSQESAAGRIAQAREALAAQEAQLSAAEENLRATMEYRAQVAQQLQAGQQEIEIQRAALADIDHQLGKMDEVQAWVEAHQTEYNQRMARLNEYIQTAGGEYNKLKAAIDSGFIHKYLHDLRALSESYEFEMAQAQQVEVNIDARLEEAKRELTALIAQAREVADAQELSMAQSAPAPIDSAEINEGHERAVADLLAQQAERQQIREKIRQSLAGEEESAPMPGAAEPPEEASSSHLLTKPAFGSMPDASARKRGRPKSGNKKR